jgi:hypothetical protein
VYGAGKTEGAMAFHTDAFEKFYPLFTVWHSGRIELQFAIWKNRPVLEDEVWRRQFVGQLNQIPGVAIPPEKAGAQPSIPLEVLEDPAARAMFTDAFADLILELRKASQTGSGPA